MSKDEIIERAPELELTLQERALLAKGFFQMQSMSPESEWTWIRARARTATATTEQRDLPSAAGRFMSSKSAVTEPSQVAAMEIVTKLAPRARQCVLLALGGFSRREIATALAIAPSTVSRHLQTVSKLIHSILDTVGPGEEPLSGPQSKAMRQPVDPATSGGTADEDLGAEIDRAYRAIERLEGSPVTGLRDKRVEHAYSRLRVLQHRESEQFRRQFADSLRMPIDAGAKILERSLTLRKQLEDLAAPDAAPARTTSA